MQLVAQREVHRPVVGGERERVEVVRRVDAGARVAVVPPGAADGGVLLEIDERDAGLLQVDRRAQARHAGADDEHLEALGHVERLASTRCGCRPSCAAIIGPYSGGTCSPIAQLSISTSSVGRRLGDGDRRPARHARMASSAASRISCWTGSGSPPVSLSPMPRRASGRYGSLQPAPLAGQLHQHHQQRRDVGDRDGLGELLLFVDHGHDQGARSL